MDNFIDNATIENLLKNELIINDVHKYVLISSVVYNSNRHTKVTPKNIEAMSKVFGDTLVIFVPSSAKKEIKLDKLTNINKIILDLRNCEIEDIYAFTVFNQFISTYKFEVEIIALKTKKEFYMSNSVPNISDNKPDETTKNQINIPVTVLIDPFTFKERNEYQSSIMKYFRDHYNVVGTPIKNSNCIYKNITINRNLTVNIPIMKII